MTIPWTEQDHAALRALSAGLGGFHVLEVIEENRMTEQAPEDFTGNDDGGWAEATGANRTFPEHPDNPHEAPLSVNFKPGGTPQLTVRGRTVQEHMDLLQQVKSSGLLALINAVSADFGGQGAAPAPQAPAQQPWNQQPAQQFPNQPFAGQPAWQTAGAPQGANVPPGWYKLTVPFPQKAAFDAIVSQYNFRKGDPNNGGQVSWQKAVKSWYCAGEIAQAFAQFNPVAA